MTHGLSAVNLRAAGLGLVAAAIAGSSVTAPAMAQQSRVSCKVTSASSTSIASQDGYVSALVDLAEFACNDSSENSITIDAQVSGVASAMAEAIAEVMGTCSGQGNAQASVSGLAMAEARAEAVGIASARILATAEVCQVCAIALDSFSTAVETVAATAVAEASISADFVFREGETQAFTVSDIQRVVESNIIQLLGSVTGEIRSAADGCSGSAVTLSQAGDTFATCNVEVSASDISEAIDAVADAGVSVQALACSDDGTEAEARLIAREIARAVAQGVVEADTFCESNGGPGTIACGLSTGTINAVATATASAFVTAIAEARGEDCDCDVAAELTADAVVEIMAEASTSALAQTCAEGVERATESDFQRAVEVAMGVAIAEAIASAVAGAECTVSGTVCADAVVCVESSGACATLLFNGIIVGVQRCCDPDDVCVSGRSRSTPQCVSRAFAEAIGRIEAVLTPTAVQCN